jgi:hypothetical protein
MPTTDLPQPKIALPDPEDLGVREYLMYGHAAFLVWCMETQSSHLLEALVASAAFLSGDALEEALAPKMELIYENIADGKFIRDMTDVDLPDDAIALLDRAIAEAA